MKLSFSYLKAAATFVVPIRTESKLNGTVGSWRSRAGKTKRERIATHYAFPHGMKGIFEMASSWEVTLTRQSPGELDPDNLRGALKGIRDQVCQELGGKDDRDPRFTWIYRQERSRSHGVKVGIRAVGGQKEVTVP